MPVVRYSVGNEHNRCDPFGRSELEIGADGSARLQHHFSRVMTVSAWTGRVDPAALDRLWAAPATAGFPATPTATFLPGSTLRRLTVETDGPSRQAIGAPQQATVDRHGAAKLPGCTEAFDLLDGIVRQLSGAAVKYPTTQAAIVHDAAPVGAT